MEINSSRNSRKKVVNAEGSIVLDRDPKIQLYLEASNLKLKSDCFYQKADEKLESFYKMLQEEQDIQYLAGLAKFLADQGIKLSPVVISSILSNKHYSFREKKFEKIFNTPQRIAEALAIGKRYKLNNSFKQNCLRKALQEMKEHTLKKNRLENRNIKLKDCIKLLRPKPENDSMAQLYKAIIESSKLSRLKSEENLLAMKSDKTKTEEQKIEYYQQNIDKIPINMLVRNLKFIAENCRYQAQTEMFNKVIKRLNSIDSLRFVNIFDLIEAAVHVPELQKPLHEVVFNFVQRVKKKNKLDFTNATVLFDRSGSMDSGGSELGFKYLVLFTMLYDNLSLRFFGSELWKENKELMIISEIKHGNYQKAYDAMKNNPDGTALIDSCYDLISNNTEIKELIVISDEISWSEGTDLSRYIAQLDVLLQDKRLILVNPVVYKGTCFAKNVVGIASLTSSIIMDMSLFAHPKAFVEYIRGYDFD
jgi:hypothetical protein